MHNGVTVAIVERTKDLSGKLACVFLSQFAVADDIIEHLSAIDILEEEIEVALCDDDIPHSANIWMSKQRDNGGFTDGPNLPILVFWSCGRFLS